MNLRPDAPHKPVGGRAAARATQDTRISAAAPSPSQHIPRLLDAGPRRLPPPSPERRVRMRRGPLEHKQAGGRSPSAGPGAGGLNLGGGCGQAQVGRRVRSSSATGRGGLRPDTVDPLSRRPPLSPEPRNCARGTLGPPPALRRHSHERARCAMHRAANPPLPPSRPSGRSLRRPAPSPGWGARIMQRRAAAYRVVPLPPPRATRRCLLFGPRVKGLHAPWRRGQNAHPSPAHGPSHSWPAPPTGGRRHSHRRTEHAGQDNLPPASDEE